MTINIKDFVKKWNGNRNNYDGAYGYQCVDLIKIYLKDVFGVDKVGVLGDANENLKNLPKYNFQIINNKQKPIRGDVVVWDKGSYGHVAIVLAYDDAGFWILEQNGGSGSATGIGDDAIRIRKIAGSDQEWGYHNIIGYARHKNISSIVSKSEFDRIVHTKGLYLWEATNYLKREDVAQKVFYYLAGYKHTINGKNSSHIWNGQYWQGGTKRQELAHMIVNFYNRVLGKNITYQTLIEKSVWNGSRPEDTVRGEEFTLMIHRVKTAL